MPALTVVIVARGQDGAIVGENDGVFIARRDRNHVLAHQTLHAHGHLTCRRVALRQLTVGILPACPHLALFVSEATLRVAH